MRPGRSFGIAILSSVILAFFVGLSLHQTLAAQRPSGGSPQPTPETPDRNTVQPELDINKRPIPNHFILFLCKGTHYDMTPMDGKRDRYGTPHGIRVTNNTDKGIATGGEQGENGTIRINSGVPGVPAQTGILGETTIEYDIIDRSNGRAVEHVTVKVKVIDCAKKKKGISTKTKVLVGAGAVAGGVIAVAAGGGDKPPSTGTTNTVPPTPATTSSTTSSTSSSTSSSVSTTTVSNVINVSGNFGDYNILATKTVDTGCNFSPTFTGVINLSGNNDGSNLSVRMIERLVRTYAGSMQANGTFSGTGTGNLDGFTYNGTITGQVVSGNTVAGTEVLNFTGGCPGRQVGYSFTGSRAIQ